MSTARANARHTCLRRMESVTDSDCHACFIAHPQLRSAYQLRHHCCNANLVQIEPHISRLKHDLDSPTSQDTLAQVAAQMRREGRTEAEIAAFGRGLVLLFQT